MPARLLFLASLFLAGPAVAAEPVTPDWLLADMRAAAGRLMDTYLQPCGHRHVHHLSGQAHVTELHTPAIVIEDRAPSAEDEAAGIDARGDVLLTAVAMRTRPVGELDETLDPWGDWQPFAPVRFHIARENGEWRMAPLGEQGGFGLPTRDLSCGELDDPELLNPDAGLWAAEGTGITPVRPLGDVEPTPPPRPEAAAPVPLRQRSADEVADVMRAQSWRFFDPYSRLLVSEPDLRGTVTLLMTVTPEGEVTRATLEDSELDHPVLEQQILDGARAIRFRSGHYRPLTFRFPIRLQPGG